MEAALGMELPKGHLDVEYSPSKWSQRMCSCKVIPEHLTFIREESERARNELPCQIGIAYGESEAEQLDIIGTDLPDDAPICFFVHGGFWQKLSKDDSAYPAQVTHELGMKLFVVGYALCPYVTLHTITLQILRAYNFTLDYAQRNGTRSIHLIGHSAGAHLVANLLGQKITILSHRQLSWDLVKNVILVSGLYDLRPLLRSQENAALKLSMQDATDLSPLLWKIQTNDLHSERENLRKHSNSQVFVVIAEHDSSCFRAQSLQFYGKLRNFLKKKVVYKDVKGLDHFDIMHSIIAKKIKENSYEYLFAKWFKEIITASNVDRQQ